MELQVQRVVRFGLWRVLCGFPVIEFPTKSQPLQLVERTFELKHGLRYIFILIWAAGLKSANRLLHCFLYIWKVLVGYI